MKDTETGVRETEVNVNCGIIPQRRKLHKERAPETLTGSFEFLAEYEFVCPKGETPQYQAKNHCPKEQFPHNCKRNDSEFTQGWELFKFPSTREERWC